VERPLLTRYLGKEGADRFLRWHAGAVSSRSAVPAFPASAAAPAAANG
jgi:hypothetical protein